MHLRSILDLPCPSPIMRTPIALTVAIVAENTPEEVKEIVIRAMKSPLTSVHCYDSHIELQQGRTMGRYTVCAGSARELGWEAEKLGIPSSIPGLDIPSARLCFVIPSVAVAEQWMGHSNVGELFSVLDKHQIKYDFRILSLQRSPTKVYEFAQNVWQWISGVFLAEYRCD